MAVKIRFARIGRHKDPFYRIVVADSRYSTTGRYIEQIGTYDPKKDQASANVDLELAKAWVLKGAQPTDSVRAILSKKGFYSSTTPAGKKPAKKTKPVTEKPVTKKPAAKKAAAPKKTKAE